MYDPEITFKRLDNHYLAHKSKLPSGYTLEVRFSLYDDGRFGKGIKAYIELFVSRKRKFLNFSILGSDTGPGGVEVYSHLVRVLNQFPGHLIDRYDVDYLVYSATGYNKNLKDAYSKVLPRLGFHMVNDGWKTMEKIMFFSEEKRDIKYDYSVYKLYCY